jgi:hypothetical protein
MSFKKQRAYRLVVLLAAEAANVAVAWAYSNFAGTSEQDQWLFAISWLISGLLAFLSGFMVISEEKRQQCWLSLVVLFAIYSVWVAPMALAMLGHSLGLFNMPGGSLGHWILGILLSGVIGVPALVVIGLAGCLVKRVRFRGQSV